LDSKTFFQQLATIYKEINVQKSKVDAVQEQIDILYSDPLTEKLLSFDYPQKRNEEYLWKKIFLAGNLKNKEEFEKIFGQSKSYFSPFISPIIYPELIKNFSQSLISVYNKVSPNLSELLNNMKGKQKLSENTKVLENYITELLTVAQE